MKSIVLPIAVIVVCIALFVLFLVNVIDTQQRNDDQYLRDHHCVLTRDVEGIVKVYRCDDGAEIFR